MRQWEALGKARVPWRQRMAVAVFSMITAMSAANAAGSDPRGKPVDAAQPALQVVKLRPDFTMIAGAGGNVLVWSGAEGVVLVDTGLASASATLFDTIARVAPGRLRFVISTHGHPDHVGGNEMAASKGAVIIAHDSIESLARPTITTNDALALHLNGDRLDIIHTADAHTRADLVLRWAQADVIDLGDLYWNGEYPIIDVAGGGSLAGLVAAVEAALARATDRTLVVPGHGAPSGRADLAAYRDMLVTVGRTVREAIEQGKGIDEILAMHPTAPFDARFGQGPVTSEDFVRIVHRDLTERRIDR